MELIAAAQGVTLTAGPPSAVVSLKKLNTTARCGENPLRPPPLFSEQKSPVSQVCWSFATGEEILNFVKRHNNTVSAPRQSCSHGFAKEHFKPM